MKKASYLLPFFLFMSLSSFTSCEDEEQIIIEPPFHSAAEELAGTWNIISVSREGTAVDLEGDTITISFTDAGLFSSTNASAMPGTSPGFPENGSWEFGSAVPPFSSIVITPANFVFNETNLSNNTFAFNYISKEGNSNDRDVAFAVIAKRNE